MLFRAALLLALAAAVCGSCQNNRAFSLTNPGSWLVPDHFRSIADIGSELHCSTRCRALSWLCYGFYWLQKGSLCRLFNSTVFFNESLWLSSPEQRNLYTVPLGELRISGCTQSSTFRNAFCSKALDGNTAQNFAGGSCSHTLDGADQWWEVELVEVSRISAVQIYNRQDCCADRLNSFALLLDGIDCARVNLTVSFSVMTLDCVGFGKRIRVASLYGLPVTLCEVQLL